MNEEIKNLQTRLDELLQWKKERIQQQIKYPLDIQSQKILQEDLLVFTGNIINVPPALSDNLAFGIEVSLNGNKYILYATEPLKAFTAAVTDICTYVNGSHGLIDGNQVAVVSTGTLPAGLSDGAQYFIISSTASTFKLSLTLGGSAVDITDAGTGTHYFGKI